MTIAVRPILDGFVARIDGLDAPCASKEDVAALKSALMVFPVIVMADQHMTSAEQVAFATKFGPIDVNELARKFHNPGVPAELVEPSNNDPAHADSERMRVMELGNTFWHTDSSFKTTPAHLSMLYCLKAAREGGETQYADLRAGYDALPPDLKCLIEGMAAEHCVMQMRLLLGYEHTPAEREAFKAVAAYDVVRVLPETGRKTLYLSAHATHILGMPYAEGRVLLNELTERATTQSHVYTHKWSDNDFVIWDNRCTMHRLCRYKPAAERRHLRRVATRDEAFASRLSLAV